MNKQATKADAYVARECDFLKWKQHKKKVRIENNGGQKVAPNNPASEITRASKPALNAMMA
ncbi:MAG TPA: hypothetical protein VHM90_16365, partial [Phycisphaerae bacterium]|nr:hypothetical protein [Phycisphaerae bacterium]